MAIVYRESPLLQVLDHFGGKAAYMARVFKVSNAVVGKWLEVGYLPPLRAIQVQVMTGGKFKAENLIDRSLIDGLK